MVTKTKNTCNSVPTGELKYNSMTMETYIKGSRESFKII